jgi:ribulose-bisphosphate carboxylase large chain
MNGEGKDLLRFPEAINSEDYVIATYYLETPMDPHQAADHLAAEESTGTWMRARYESDERRERFGAKAVGVYPLPYEPLGYSLPARMDWLKEEEQGEINAAVVRIAFPWVNFGPLFPNLLSTVAGNLYEMDPFTAIRLIDLEFPPSFTDQFTGPKFSIDGCREILGVYDRPLFGAIIKPCVGLSPQEIADLAYQGAKGGLDFIKDDELMADTTYNPVKERAAAITEALKRAEAETGEKTMYAFNITDRPSRLRELHDVVVEAGGNCVMVNAATLGYESLRELAEFTQVPIHAHRDFAPAYLRSPYTGMSAEVFSKLWRLAGADQLHIGAIGGKLFERDEEVMVNARACLQDFNNISQCLPVSSGGQWAGKVAHNLEAFGHVDFLHLSGAGVYAHPDGAEAGARSVRLAWDAHSNGIPLEEYAAEHPELQRAIEHFSA